MEEIKKKSIALLVVLIAISLSVMPVHAYSQQIPYNYYSIDPTFGTWDSSDEEACEGAFGLAYRCQITFEYRGISTTADEYKIQIDYDLQNPYYPRESLCVYYRWGTSGSWIWICNLDSIPYDGFILIGAATSSTCQILFVDGIQIFDFLQHTWYFGNEPVVWAYWD